VIIVPVAVDDVAGGVVFGLGGSHRVMAVLRHIWAEYRKRERGPLRQGRVVSTAQAATGGDRTIDQYSSAWRRVRLWAGAHAVDDLYQGLIPAAVPYFVLQRHFSYVEASGLVLAATLGSALPQPAVPRRPASAAVAGAARGQPGRDRRRPGGPASLPPPGLAKLGQDYLPTRPSTAAGVTFGLSVSAGGLFMPLLGLVADHSGPRGVFVVLALIPLIAVAISTALREPRGGAGRTWRRRSGANAPAAGAGWAVFDKTRIAGSVRASNHGATTGTKRTHKK
jgi:hypothetical protein